MEDPTDDWQSPPYPRRRTTIRLSGYDYRLPGTYFVTICTQRPLHLFGDVHDGRMHLNDIGTMVAETWLALPQTFPGVGPDTMTIMPDHLHAVIMLGINPAADVETAPGLGNVVRYFKGRSTHRYIKNYVAHGWSPLEQRLWQRQYHDRIIRGDRELESVRGYIDTNPH